MGVQERQARDKENFRKTVLDAARELIREIGYEKLTVRKIADKIEYSPMSLYNHFSDKDAILIALAGEGFAKLGKVLPKPDSDAPITVLRHAMLQYIAFGLKHPDEYQIVFMTRRSARENPTKSPSAEENVPNDAGGQTAVKQMLAYIDAALGNKSIQGDRFDISKVLWAGIHGCVSLQITQTRFPFGPPKLFAENVVDTLLRGIHTNPAAR